LRHIKTFSSKSRKVTSKTKNKLYEPFLNLLLKKAHSITYQIGTNKVDYDPTSDLLLKARHGFGDNLMVTAVIKGIHCEYPDLRILVLSKHPEIFEMNPHIVACYNINDISKNHSLYKKAVDMLYRPFGKHRRRFDNKSHQIDDMYNCLPLKLSSRNYIPQLFLTDTERLYCYDDLENLNPPLVTISPYGKMSSPIPSKIYPKSMWEKVVELLIKAGVTIIQVGSKSEGDLLSGTLDYRGIGYRHTAAVLSHCDAMVTHPGGMMHLAAACKIKCVALYGGIEDPRLSGYPQNRNITVSLECAPCWREKLCKKPHCLELMTPERVVGEVLDFITSPSQQNIESNRQQNLM